MGDFYFSVWSASTPQITQSSAASLSVPDVSQLDGPFRFGIATVPRHKGTTTTKQNWSLYNCSYSGSRKMTVDNTATWHSIVANCTCPSHFSSSASSQVVQSDHFSQVPHPRDSTDSRTFPGSLLTEMNRASPRPLDLPEPRHARFLAGGSTERVRSVRSCVASKTRCQTWPNSESLIFGSHKKVGMRAIIGTSRWTLGFKTFRDSFDLTV